MAGSRKSADKPSSTTQMPGVEETGAVFEAPANDRWTIARERLAEYRRTGEAVSVDEFMAELDRQIELARANKA